MDCAADGQQSHSHSCFSMLRSTLAMLCVSAALLLHAQVHAQAPTAMDSVSTARHAPLPRFEILPSGQLFPSLIASLQEPQLRNSLIRARSERDFNTLLGVTEQGASLSLWRMNGRRRGDGLELSIQGSAAAQFDLASSRWTLLNADYTFSYPVTVRRGPVAARFRYVHLSSHLGDRYLLQRPDARRFGGAGYRRESVELLVARTFGDSTRSIVAYTGGAHAFAVTPKDMKRGTVRGGLDASRRFHEFGTTARASWVGGAEVSLAEERGWNAGVSARLGYEIGRAGGEWPGGRRYRMLVEFYDGPATYGHFSREDRLRYVGIGCYVIP